MYVGASNYVVPSTKMSTSCCEHLHTMCCSLYNYYNTVCIVVFYLPPTALWPILSFKSNVMLYHQINQYATSFSVDTGLILIINDEVYFYASSLCNGAYYLFIDILNMWCN